MSRNPWKQGGQRLVAALALALFGTGVVVAGGREDQVTQAFLTQERDVWDLESRLLKEAIDAVAGKGDISRRGELSHRKIVREGRSAQTLRKVRDFVEEYLSVETRDLLRDVAEANGTRPEEVFADYLTVEATVDFALMAAAYNTVHGNNLEKFPADAKRLLKDLVDNLRKPPVPANDIQVGNVRSSRMSVNVFGCDITEEVDSVDVQGRTANLNWRSNYLFLRDLSERRNPRETREERLTSDGGRWLISYRDELEEFVNTAGRTEWGKKVRELANIDSYLSKRDPLDETKARRSRYVYDPDGGDDYSAAKFTGDRSREEDRTRRDTARDTRDTRDDRRRDDRDDRRRDDRDDRRRYD